MLPTTRGAECYDQLPKSRICVIEMGVRESKQLAGKVARDAAGAIRESGEMTLLRRQEIRRHGGTAGIIELLRIRLRLPLYSLDIAKVGFAAVDPTHPKAGC